MPPSLTLAFVMDPPATINPLADTTFAFMVEAQKRGHRILYVDPADLGFDHDRVARAWLRSP